VAVGSGLATGRETRRTLQGNAPIVTISVAADERSALVSREDRAEVDLMLAPVRHADRSAYGSKLTQKLDNFARGRP